LNCPSPRRPPFTSPLAFSSRSAAVHRLECRLAAAQSAIDAKKGKREFKDV
jgi:hypothetical protein